MKKEVLKLQARNREIQDELAATYDKQAKEKRELTAEESAKVQTLTREFESNRREILLSKDAEAIGQMRENENKNVLLREYLKGVKEGRENATTILLNPATGTDANLVKNIKESGAIPLTIQDVLDTKVEGIGLPPGTNLLTGVVGDVLWPVSADDVVVSVAGEVAQIEEQALSFTNIKAHSERLTAAVAVSNKAIDNAAFDLYTFVTVKIQKGLAIKLAERVYGHDADWTDEFKGPFARCTAGTITKGAGFAKALAMAVAEIADQGFEGEPVIVIDKVTEAELKYTPANDFSGNTDAVIKDGKLAGYNYVTSGKINLGGSTGERFIGIGYFEYLALQQHGDVRFTVDSTSAQVSGRNSTVFTLNTDFSATELSSVINGQSTNEGEPKAFKLLKIVDSASSNEIGG